MNQYVNGDRDAITLIEEKLNGKIDTLNKKVEELNEKIVELNTKTEKLGETEDISSSIHLNSEYVSKRGSLKMTRNGNTIVLTAYLNILKSMPNLTTIINIDQQYSPKNRIVTSTVYNGNAVRYVEIYTDGTIKSNSIETGTTMEVNFVWQI